MRNGSFAVVRRLRQHVAAFHKFASDQVAPVSAALGHEVTADEFDRGMGWVDGVLTGGRNLTIVTGAKGRVEVDVPLANIGNPPSGTHLTSIQAQTGAATTAIGFVADSAASAKEYAIGGTSCLK